MRNFYIVFHTIFRESIKSKLFINLTLAMVLAGVLIACGPMLFGDKKEPVKNYTLVNETSLPLESGILSKASKQKFSIKTSDKLSNLKKAVKDEKIDGFLILKDKGRHLSLNYYFKELDPATVAVTESVVNEMKMYDAVKSEKIKPETIAMLSKPVHSEQKSIYESKENGSLIILGLISMMIMAITIYGNNVATAIAAEKQSRVMEVMITKVKPVPMMFGKILGIGLASLIQILIFFMTITVLIKSGYVEIKKNSYVEVIDQTMNWDTVLILILMFTLGYFIYTTMFAIIGAMVARPEDLTSATIPVVVILLGSLLIEMFYCMESPDSMLTVVTSYIPFTAPMSVTIRLIYGLITPGELGVCVAVMILFIGLFAALAAKIYPKGVMKSDALTLKQIFAKA